MDFVCPGDPAVRLIPKTPPPNPCSRPPRRLFFPTVFFLRVYMSFYRDVGDSSRSLQVWDGRRFGPCFADLYPFGFDFDDDSVRCSSAASRPRFVDLLLLLM
jgi:hypothetical protein